jgi:serine/threonine-protein kinase
MVVGDTYEITRVIGQGGMGAVWEAKHLRLPGKRVVIKVLLYGTTEPLVLARFRREAEIGSRLGHPNIVQVLDFNTLPGGAPYIVLELLSGETLSARLRRGRLPQAEVLDVVSQVGSALAAAHREGIVHRDLKPDNIFLCPMEIGGEIRHVVKILDFGISKIRGSRTVLTQDSALVGTPQYMAPEQATGANDEIDARTDIFALGAITFEMLAGRPPFFGESLASVIHAVVYAPTPPLAQYAPDVPPAIAAAVDRALRKPRDERFPDVASFLRALGGEAPRTTPSVPVSGGTQMLGASTPPPGHVTRERARTTTPELPRSAIPTDRVERPKPFPVVPFLGALVVAGGIAAALLWPKGPPAVQQQQPEVARPPGGVQVTPSVLATAEHANDQPAAAAQAAPAAAQPPPPPAAAATAPPPPPAAEPAAVAVAEGDRRPAPAKPSPARAERSAAGGSGGAHHALSPAAAADLAEAEAALDGGNPADAIRLAQHSLYAQQSGRAYAVMARARCAQGDLGNAKAAFAHVDAGDKAAVLRDCRKLGIQLR